MRKTTRWASRTCRTGQLDETQEPPKLIGPVAFGQVCDHLVGSDGDRRVEVRRAHVGRVMARTFKSPGRIGKTGLVRSCAWTSVFSSTESTGVAPGGLMIHTEPDHVADLLREWVVRRLQLVDGMGFSPRARQMRLIADWLMPVSFAIDRADRSSPVSTGIAFGRPRPATLHGYATDSFVAGIQSLRAPDGKFFVV
jgi:hypothetical protein